MNLATPEARDAYIRRETAISIGINSVLSLSFFALLFQGLTDVELWGKHGLIMDCLPQGFMIGLMSTLVPGLLTVRRLAASRTGSDLRIRRFPGMLVVLALCVAIGAAAVGTTMVAAIAMAVNVASVTFPAAAVLKVLYGGLLAAVVTPPVVRAALKQRV